MTKNKLLIEMAYPRAVFINKIEEIVGGALGEFYKAEYAKANNLMEWVAGWYNEVERLFSVIALQIYIHPITFKDRRKAFEQAILELKSVDKSYRTYAMNRVKGIYKVKKLKQSIPDDASERFFAKLEEHIVATEF